MDDVLIVGAGVIGLSLAYELGGRGARVHVLDRGSPGREASWAGAGILPPANRQTAIDPIDQLRGWSHELYPQWSVALREATGIDNGYRRCGGIYLARSVGEAAALQGLAAAWRQQRIRIVPLAADELQQVEPALVPSAESGAIRAAYLAPDEAQLRNPRHLQALAQAGRQRGVRISQDVEVTGFDIRAGRMCGVRTAAGRLEAGQFAITSGAWTGRLLQQLGCPIGIRPVRGQMILFRCQRQPFVRVINEGPRYLVARDDGRVLVGSSEEEAGYDKGTTEPILAELRQLAGDLVPELRQAEIERVWAGLRPGSSDGRPYIDRIPQVANAFVAAGHYRSGLHLAPATAILMRQLMLGEPPSIDLSPFRIGRN
jgi:glycine oxidase